MKGLSNLFSTSVLVLAAVAASCASAEPANTAAAGPSPASVVSTEDEGFNFQGDFKGPLGLQLYSVRREMAQDVPGTLRRVHDLGFREVELAGTYGLSAAQFRQELDRAGLRATSMHVGYQRLRDSLQTVLNEAKTLGVDYVGVASIPYPRGETFTVEMARRAAADFNRWGTAAREQGLQFFYHIHGFEFRPSESGELPFDVIVRETDPENVKFQMDVLWAAAAGQDPVALLRKYPNRWELTHLKDAKGRGSPYNPATANEPPMVQLPVGSGDIDFRAVLRTAQEIGVERHFLEDETENPFATIPQSIQWLRTVRY